MNEGVVTAGERKKLMLAFSCADAISRWEKEKEKERSLHIFWLAIQWKQM